MTAPPGIVEKIKKLLALAARGEPHEAALALEMAQRMMREHDVTAEEAEVGRIGSERLRSVATKSKVKGWELRLYSGIAEAFGCGLMFEAGMDGVTDRRMYATYLFIGPKAEAQLSQYAAHVLQRQLTRARAAFTSSLPDYMTRGEKTGEVDAYCLGWVGAALSKVTKLVPNPARAAAIVRHIKENAASRKVGQQQRSGSADALNRGSSDGADASLNRPVEGRDAASLGEGQRALPDLTGGGR